VSVIELPRPAAPAEELLPADPEWDEDDQSPEPETRICHVVNPRDRSRSLCGLRRPAGAPTFTGDLRTWLDCADCRRIIGLA
jgi:hypothetical protein